jgi:hypothetical protein
VASGHLAFDSCSWHPFYQGTTLISLTSAAIRADTVAHGRAGWPDSPQPSTLIAQTMLSPAVVPRLPAVAMDVDPKGNWVIDWGNNVIAHSGVPKVGRAVAQSPYAGPRRHLTSRYSCAARISNFGLGWRVWGCPVRVGVLAVYLRVGCRAGGALGEVGEAVWVSDSPADDVKGSPSLPGAGAKQEPRLFRDLPELLSTAADGPVMGRGFSVSAGQ